MNESDKDGQYAVSNRIGEKIGWIGGWTGGFCWVIALAIVRFVQDAMLESILGIAIFVVAEVLIVMLGPWRYPATRYYLLMLPIYGLFLASVVWAVWSFGGLHQAGLNYWNVLLIFPCLSPLITIGWRRWKDFHIPEK